MILTRWRRWRFGTRRTMRTLAADVWVYDLLSRAEPWNVQAVAT